MNIRTPLGRFERQHQLWTPDNWDDGFIDNKGRFRVYRPDYPHPYPEGYCLRAHVVWWLHTGTAHPKGTNLHHKNEIRTDDRFENLELLGHGEHTRHHCYKPNFVICPTCGRSFNLPKGRIAGRLREPGGYAPKYCSQECYHATPRTDAHKANISDGLKMSYLEGRR